MSVTGLKTFVVNAGSLNWVFCKVYTNAGLTGLGEGSVTSKEATIAAAIQEHERFLMGKEGQQPFLPARIQCAELSLQLAERLAR